MSSEKSPPDATRRHVTLAITVACLTLTAMWWSTRSSLAAIGASEQVRVCRAIYPAPPSCHPTWHIQVTALVTLGVVAVLVGAVVAIRHTRGRAAPATLAALTLVGLSAWWLTADPNRFLPIW